MIDARGRIIPNDFGFILTNSPGAIKFENVPIKLTEYLQVICAKKNEQDLSEKSKTEGYRYFQAYRPIIMFNISSYRCYRQISNYVPPNARNR